MTNNSRFFFILMSVSAVVGLGNMWSYSYFSFRLTGLFFIPYAIALLLLGVPLLMLEFSVGQYFNKNVIDLFASIRKWFSSIGWLMLFNAFIVMSYYAVLLSWHIIYFFVSFGLQWKNNSKDYFFSNVLQASDGFRSFTQISLPVFIGLIAAWLIIFLYIRKGFEGMKKAFLITAPALVLLMLFFFIYSLTLDSALAGIHSFLMPNFRNLLRFDVWINAFSLAASSLGLSFGIMAAFARKSGKGLIVGNSFIAAFFKLLAGIALGFVLFGMLGFLNMKTGLSFDNLVFSDLSSRFTILAQALPFFYKPTLLSLLFFMFLSLFFLLGAASLAYSITHVLVHKFRTKHFNAAIIVAGFGFLFGLMFVIRPGFYIMDIVSHFVYYNILIAILLEAVAVGWFFDSDKISDFINSNSILKIGVLWRFFIRYLIPIIITALIFLQLKKDVYFNYNNYPLLYLLIFGVSIVVIPWVAAFLMPQKILDRK